MGYSSVVSRTSSRVPSGPLRERRTPPLERVIQVAVVILGLVAVIVAAIVLMPPSEFVQGPGSTHGPVPGAGTVTDTVKGGATGRQVSPANGAGSQAAANGGPASATRAACGMDATSSLQRLISSTANGGLVNLLAGKCYDVEGTLLIDGRSNLTIDGHGATLRSFTRGTRERMFIKIHAASGIVLKNLTLWGPNEAGVYDSSVEAQHGVGVLGGTDIIIDGVHVKQVYGDGVTLRKAGDGSQAPADHVIIRNSTFDTIGRQGISPVFATNILISGNSFDHVARTVIDMEPDTASYVIQNVTIENNHVGFHGHFFVGSGGAGCNVSHIVVRDNESDGGTLAFVTHSTTCRKRDILIEGNLFRLEFGTAKGAWAYFAGVDDVTVRNNRILASRSIPGVGFFQSGGTLTVTGNTFTGTCDAVEADQSAPVDASDNVTANPCPPPPKAG